MSKAWYTVFGILTVLLSLSLHRSLWITVRAHEQRARNTASRIYWVMCCCALAFAVSGLVSGPIGVLNLNTLAPRSIMLIIAATGLLGIRFCAIERMDLGAFLSSGVLVAGLVLSFASGILLWSAGSLLTIGYSAWIYSSLRAIATDAPQFLDSNDKIAGSTPCRDEAYPHSR